jgi:hypothetical protein
MIGPPSRASSGGHDVTSQEASGGIAANPQPSFVVFDATINLKSAFLRGREQGAGLPDWTNNPKRLMLHWG